MKILITGGSGLLGQYLNIFLSRENQILTLYNSNEGNCLEYNSVKCELTDFKKVKEIILSFSPKIVIHTAAISRPETCDELPKEYVINVNVNSTKEIAIICEKLGAKLIFTSTDLVYHGDNGPMHKEDSKLNPVSLYAESKVYGEDKIKNIFENYIILRTSLLFGLGLNNSVNNFHNIYHSFKNNEPVKLFYDQFRTPLSLLDAAELITQLINIDVNNITINFGGRERVSRVDLGEMLCRIGKYDKSLIQKTSMYNVANLHKVADVSMNTEKLQSFGLKQKSIEESIWEIVNNDQ